MTTGLILNLLLTGFKGWKWGKYVSVVSKYSISIKNAFGRPIIPAFSDRFDFFSSILNEASAARLISKDSISSGFGFAFHNVDFGIM